MWILTRNTTAFMILAASLLLTACATNTTPYSYVSLEDEYRSDAFFTSTFDNKRVLIAGYHKGDDAEEAELIRLISTSLADQLKRSRNVANATSFILTKPAAAADTTAESDSEQQEVLSADKEIKTAEMPERSAVVNNLLVNQQQQFDYLIDFRILDWQRMKRAERTSSRCQHAGTNLQLNMVLWDMSQRTMLWSSTPVGKIGVHKCVEEQDSNSTHEYQSDNPVGMIAEGLMYILIDSTTEAIATGISYNSMSAVRAPQMRELVEQLTGMIALQMNRY